MKGRVIALDAAGGAAVMENGRLEDLVLAPPAGAVSPGDIGAAKVTRRVKGAAFCAFGGTEGYLREAGRLAPGETVTAQVVSLPEPGKAVTLTTRILVKGARLILTPGAPGVNVSRQIGNAAERARLEAAVTEAPGAEPGLGVIVRTAARGAEPEALAAELAALLAEWRAGSGGGDPWRTVLRDWLFPLPDAILAPPRAEVPLWGDAGARARLRAEADPFEAAGVRDAMAALASPEVALDGGARMTVEATRALVAVDVDTGGDFSPAAGLKATLAAVRALPRALRLRGLGGQVVIDAAPVPRPQRRTVEDALKKAFRADPVETSLAGWTPLGHIELQRKRARRPLGEAP